MIRVGILTSSRADYGIYLPLLRAIESEPNFELGIIVFGTHLSSFHGYTLNNIEQDGFTPFATIESLLISDTPNSISTSYALTCLKFADFWKKYKSKFDIVFALGDRFEMAAAVAASIPFGIRLAHLFGGDTTLGAIDNIYRHSITLASSIHFVSTELFANRVHSILDTPNNLVYNIGSLSLENLEKTPLLTLQEFYDKWGINLQLDSILVTVHPETVAAGDNLIFCKEITDAIRFLSKTYQIIITMPNADTAGLVYRNSFEELGKHVNSIKVIENFGVQSYFTCMKFSKLLIGNTSSGIVEAASFGKYVINLGQRQAGRLCSANVVHIPFDKNAIVSNTKELITKEFKGENIYYKANPSKKIIEILKSLHG